MNRLCCSKWYILWIHTIKHSFHSIPHVILLHWKKHKGQFITQPMLYETLKRQYIPPRKMSSRSSRIYRLWMDIQHIVGPANLWPLSIRRLFWTRPLRHWQRILICTFAYVNGLNPEVLIEWVLLLRLLNNESGVRHIQSFFILVERGTNYTLYSLNVSTRRYEWLDGRPRAYLPRGERYKL